MAPNSNNPKHLPQFVGYSEVQEALGVSRRTVERMVREAKFPAPEQLSPNRVGWRVETLTVYLDERRKGIVARAVSNPDDLAPDQLANVVVDFLVQAVEREVGGPIDPHGLKVTYVPPSPELTEEQFFEAEAREAANLQQRFAGFDAIRSSLIAAWLFPELRPMLANEGHSEIGSRIFLDPERLQALALRAFSDFPGQWDEELARAQAPTAKVGD